MYKAELNYLFIHYNDYNIFLRIIEHVQQNMFRIWSSILM